MTLICRSPRLFACVAPLLAGALLVAGAAAEPPASASKPSATASIHATSLRTRAISTTALTVASATGGGSGNAVLLLATVDGQSGTVTGGSVIFTAQGKRIGEAPVANGSASLTVPTLPTGLSSFAATYKGDDTFLPSKSATIRFYKDDQD